MPDSAAAVREVARRAFEEPPDGIRCVYCGFDHPGKTLNAARPASLTDCVKTLRGELMYWLRKWDEKGSFADRKEPE